MSTILRISIVGCGAIGTEISRAIDSLKNPDVQLTYLVDIKKSKALQLAKSLKRSNPKVADLNTAIQGADLIVECADKSIVAELTTKAINQGKDVMIMTTGGLVDNLELLDLARRKNCCIYLPSGALVGIDGLKSAMAGKVYKVSLTTTKPPKALAGAPYLLKNKIDVFKLKNKKLLFKGNAKEAIKGFPANINVAVCLSLAGIGLDKTDVKIVVDPDIEINIHELEIEGEAGRIFVRIENVPSPYNPKTSFLAALSAVATFRRIIDPIKIGT